MSDNTFIVKSGQVGHSQEREILGTVFKENSAVLMARLADSAGQAITQSQISAIRYWIYELDASRPDQLTVVSGHDQVDLAVSDVVHDTLQTDDLWSVDTDGYNFCHQIDTTASAAFPVAGAAYQIRYEITPAAGEKVIVRYQVKAY